MALSISIVPWLVGPNGTTMGSLGGIDQNGDIWFYSSPGAPNQLVWNPTTRTTAFTGTGLPNTGFPYGSVVLPVGNKVFCAAGYNSSGGTILGYMLDLATGSVQTSIPHSPVTLPWAVTYDGSRVWMADRSRRNLFQLNASTGAILNIFGPFGTGSSVLESLGNDGGSNIWIFDDQLYGGSGNIFVVSASSGLLVNTISPPSGYQFSPGGVNFFFDGSSMWLQGIALAGFPSVLLKYSTGGALLLSVALPNLVPGSNTGNGSVTTDGTNIWAISASSGTGGGISVTVVNPTTGAIVVTQRATPRTLIGGAQNFNGLMQVNGTDMWTPNNNSTPAYAWSMRIVSLACGVSGGTVGVSYSGNFPNSLFTGPLTFSVFSGSLPAGLSLNASTGAVTGTPTTAQTKFFTIKVVDSLGYNATVSCSITIVNSGGSLGIVCASPPPGTVGEPYSHAFPASGGTMPYTAFAVISGSLPPGLTLNTSTGVVSGIPTATGSSSFTIQVTDSVPNTANTGNCSIQINQRTPKTLIYDPVRKGWEPWQYNVPMNVGYWEEGESLTSQLLLGTDGNVYQVGGASDNGTAISVTFYSPITNGGNPRTEKFWSDEWLDADPQGVTTLQVNLGFEFFTTAFGPLTIGAGQTGRGNYPIDIGAAVGNLGINAQIQISWSSATAAPIIYEWQPWAEDTETVLRTSWASLPTSHGLKGYQHIRDGYLPLYVPNAGTINLVVTIDGQAQPAIPFNPTPGVLQKLRMDFVPNPNKGLMFTYQILPTVPFLIFERDLEITCKEWGSTAAYLNIRPLGD